MDRRAAIVMIGKEHIVKLLSHGLEMPDKYLAIDIREDPYRDCLIIKVISVRLPIAADGSEPLRLHTEIENGRIRVIPWEFC